PRAPAAPRAVRDARSRRPLRAAVPARLDRPPQVRHRGRAHVYEQLVADHLPPVVRRRSGATRAAEAPVVACDRRAVLPDLAAAAVARIAQDRTAAAAAGDD